VTAVFKPLNKEDKMKLSTRIKTAASVVIAIGTLFFASTVSAHNQNVEDYVNALVTSHITETQTEIANQTAQQVLTANYRFSLDTEGTDELIAKVKITYLSKAEIKQNAAE
jgi:Ca2+-binding RTX toxin-like protein